MRRINILSIRIKQSLYAIEHHKKVIAHHKRKIHDLNEKIHFDKTGTFADFARLVGF